jgi:hypothetical protein
MRLKGPLSGLLVASLLAMSSWASACDLSCSLQTLHSGCMSNFPTDRQAGIMSAGMNMDQENSTAIAEAEPNPQVAMIPLMDVPCAHEMCGRVSVSTSAVSTDHRAFKSAHMPAVSMTHPLVRLLHSFRNRAQASPPKFAAIRPISTNLRI